MASVLEPVAASEPTHRIPDRFATFDRDQYDVIIIGAGTGGLTAAALLARRGRSVLVVDSHYVPGGNASVEHLYEVDRREGRHTRRVTVAAAFTWPA